MAVQLYLGHQMDRDHQRWWQQRNPLKRWFLRSHFHLNIDLVILAILKRKKADDVCRRIMIRVKMAPMMESVEEGEGVWIQMNHQHQILVVLFLEMVNQDYS